MEFRLKAACAHRQTLREPPKQMTFAAYVATRDALMHVRTHVLNTRKSGETYASRGCAACAYLSFSGVFLNLPSVFPRDLLVPLGCFSVGLSQTMDQQAMILTSRSIVRWKSFVLAYGLIVQNDEDDADTHHRRRGLSLTATRFQCLLQNFGTCFFLCDAYETTEW